ncbi:deoxynucleoside kinase [Halanaerobium congolense]|jgi:thymidylate kinase|uniref:deoxynucleoside kinase n=1 Tax=Halanaerobium congolense TaxID=54121 RepID=UPI001061FFB5|nr:deoxynucleoside kinase [Halanaerobium congolense]TDP26851.1 thymidylate kinase [Halanaerobium congolense]
MNIIFEGIDGTGKTTLINRIIKKLNEKSYKTNYIKEIEDTPLQPVLKKMLDNDPFFKNNKDFKTSVFETFILAADFFYKQEYFRGLSDCINFYDRDFLTILCYQKIILENEYGKKINPFYDHFVKCLTFDLKKIDLLIYIKTDCEVNFKRIEMRDNVTLRKDQKDFLIKAKEHFESYLLPELKENGIKVLYLDGLAKLEKNIKLIVGEIKSAKTRC